MAAQERKFEFYLGGNIVAALVIKPDGVKFIEVDWKDNAGTWHTAEYTIRGYIRVYGLGLKNLDAILNPTSRKAVV